MAIDENHVTSKRILTRMTNFLLSITPQQRLSRRLDDSEKCMHYFFSPTLNKLQLNFFMLHAHFNQVEPRSQYERIDIEEYFFYRFFR